MICWRRVKRREGEGEFVATFPPPKKKKKTIKRDSLKGKLIKGKG